VSDTLGPITIPDPVTIADFPLQADYGSGMDLDVPIVVHSFDQPGLKTEQRFVVGDGARRFRFHRDHLSCTEYDKLKQHWAQAQGMYAQFNYTYKGGAFGSESVTARYENPAISFPHLVGLITGDPGLTLLEVPGITPAYTSVARLIRFPDSAFTAALTQQTQHPIPLLSIQPKGMATPMYISNQRFTLDGTLYLPRLLDWSGLAQSIGESSDNATFTLGNADYVWTQLVNQINLERAVVHFSVYHVESQYIADLWGGHALAWSFDADGHFILPATDGAYELGLSYPMRLVTRNCWKVYKGRYCPSTADPATFPDCPKDYNSCIARGVPLSFGGVVVAPSAVYIKDNTTGVFGFGRSTIKSVTMTDDTVYQRSVQEVYTDEMMAVSVDVAAGRDESSYYSALGIVSDGPIGGYDSNLLLQRLDGQPPHDPIHYGGWRGIKGTDPANAGDFFEIDQAPWGVPPDGSTYSAGLAFAEIRRTDQPGLQLSQVSDHAMQVTVDQGIGGWIWTAPGQRVWQPGLSNFVWVAINVWLRARGLRCDDTRAAQLPTALMEAEFDVNQAIYSAAIADELVDKLVGTGQERQFPFRGVLKERKPLRDWLQEICNTGLGFYTFVNGKLWIGIRVDASVGPGNAYTRDQILFKSLQVTPHQPQFNWLVGQFGDEEFGFQLNNVTVYDIDHASFIGTDESPEYMISNMSFVGISNKSQCSRVVTTRLREELGGATLAEYLAARDFQFRTTILGLQTMVGDPVSVTHQWMPNGEAKGRVQKWVLNPDWSIDVACSPVTDSMYDLDLELGPKPADVPADPIIPETLPSAVGLTWMPDNLAPLEPDPLYPDPLERTFDLWQDYSITKDGKWEAALFVEGEFPINTMAPGAQPRITGWQLAPGGNLNGPMAVYLGLAQRTPLGQPLSPSNLVGMWIPAGLNNQRVTLTVALSPDGDKWDLYVGTDRRAMGFQQTGDPPQTIINFDGPIHPMTYGMPEAAARKIGIAAKHVIHSGIAGMLVTGVTGPNQIQSNDFIGSADNWVGRWLTALVREGDGTAPLWNFTVSAFDGSTGTMTVTPDCIRLDGGGAVDPTQSVQPGDVLIVRQVGVSADLNSVTDPMWNNFVARNQFNSPGLKPDAEKGNIYRILRGTGAGQWRYISGNTATTINVAPPWTTIPDATSVLIVEEASWSLPSQTGDLSVATLGTMIQIRMRVENLRNEVALVKGFIIDNQGLESDESVAPMRELFVFGEPPAVRVVGPDPGPWATLPTDQTIRIDTSANDVTVQLLPIAAYQGRTLYLSNDNGPNNGIVLCADGEFLFDGLNSNTLGPTETMRLTAG